MKSAIGPLSGHILVFCSDASLRRYLDARNWNVEKAKLMIEETLKWRSTYKPQEIRWVRFLKDNVHFISDLVIIILISIFLFDYILA